LLPERKLLSCCSCMLASDAVAVAQLREAADKRITLVTGGCIAGANCISLKAEGYPAGAGRVLPKLEATLQARGFVAECCRCRGTRNCSCCTNATAREPKREWQCQLLRARGEASGHISREGGTRVMSSIAREPEQEWHALD
jgi:hypothetical protein